MIEEKATHTTYLSSILGLALVGSLISGTQSWALQNKCDSLCSTIQQLSYSSADLLTFNFSKKVGAQLSVIISRIIWVILQGIRISFKIEW